MKRLSIMLLLAAAFTAQASDYTLDFTGATPIAAEAPILRRAEMSVSVGQVPSVAVGDRLQIALFGDVSFALKIVSAPPAGIAGQSFIARDENGSASAIVKVSKNSARISVDDFMNRRQYTVRCKDGTATIIERDNSQIEEGECGTCGSQIEEPTPVSETTTTRKSGAKSRGLLGAENTFSVASQKSVVDILVAFDKGAKAWAEDGSNWGNGGDSIEEFADYAVNKMNTVLVNSQLDNLFCYRLVGVVEIDGTWTKIDNAILLSMRAREGKFANLDQLREKYGADTITLLINRTSGNTSGIGFEYSGNAGKTLEYFEGMKYGCNVCDINTVYSRYTMSHETGHNMGCGHSNRQGSNSGPGRYSDSCGFHFPDANNVRRSTIMAYTYTGDDGYYYDPVPYFSTPDISPEEYGCPLGTNGVHNNRRTLTLTHGDISSLREHVLPYDWDVKFLDDNGSEIPDGAYFYTSCDVTLTSSIPGAEIYYTTDGTTPNKDSSHGASGTKTSAYLVYGPKTITACAVTNGVAISTRSITLNDGLTWRGDENGNGLWTNTDNSITPWSGRYFYDDAVMLPDLAGVSSATVTVQDAVSPASVWFRACETAYQFDKGSNAAQINVPDTAFAPAGDVTFNVPVKLEDAVAFTNQTGTALTFNAPFGQTIDSNGGSFAGKVNIGPYGTLTVAPGAGKTQTLEKLNNDNWYSATSTFRVGEGTVVFTGAINGGIGVTGSTKLEVGNGGNLVFDVPGGGGTGYQMDQTSLTVENGGRVTYNDMELLKRTLYLDGGAIYAKRLDLMSNPGIYVTDNSAIEDNNGGYIYIRGSSSEINVSPGKTLALDIGTDYRNDTSGNGIIKYGGGTIAANSELKHNGVTDIEEGTLEVGYSSGSTVYGMGWTVASNSTLRVKSGCTLKVPSLTLDPTSTLSLPAATSAPIVVNGNVDLTDVRISIQAGGDLSLGASYPLISSTGEISGLKTFIRDNWPRPTDGLGWKVAVSDGALTATIVNIADADPYLDFMTNISGLRPTIPEDATMSAAGGLQIASSPIVIDGLTTNAVGVTLDVTIGEPTAAERTICSWVVDGNIARCVVTNGVLDCFHGTDGHVKNDASFLTLSPGRHVINVGYKSLNDNTYGGTFVYVDGTLAYRAAGLRWSGKSVTKFTVGATAKDAPDKPYTGLVVHNFALLNESSSDPLPNMTSSGGTVEYDYFAGKPPCVFALTPDGGFETYSAILSGAFPGNYNALSVSVVASFPENVTGTIVSSVVLDGYYGYSTQVEYRGNGVLAFRDNGSSSLIASVQVSADMSARHLYTLTYTNGTGYKLYLDGAEVLSNTSYYNGKNMPIINRVVFGCGYWTNWMTSYNDNPNPITNLKVYASHIALGTDDRTVSEGAVESAMSGGESGDDPEEPEEPDPEPPATPAVVDVLVAYDNGAQAYVANKSQKLEEFAEVQIQKMNDVLVTNKLDRFYSYRLAGVCKVDGVYDNIDTAPAQIAAGTGPAVSLRAAREMCGADTVTLLVDVTGNTLGNSSPLNSPDNVASQHECAFSVCSIRAVDTGKQHTMIHENAHNMGCGHARAQSIINSSFDYGRGYYFKDGNVTRHTIMAYGGDNDASWYFSTTSKEFGFTLGDKTNNNARVLKETCGEVAKWREGAAIPLDSVKVEGVTFETSALYPWSVDGNGILRSFNQTNYTYQCTTPLKATIVGPKRFLFKHKSYFGGESVAGNNYSHFDILLDDSPVLTQTECTNTWTEAYVDVPDGEHEVTFVFSQRYAMNNPSDYKDGTPEADDAVWLMFEPKPIFDWTPGENPSGWFTAWQGENSGSTHEKIGPDGLSTNLYVTYVDDEKVDTQKWIPWKSGNLTPDHLDNYTFLAYGNIDEVSPESGKLAVLWDMGFNNTHKTMLVKDDAGHVKLVQADGSNNINKTIDAGTVEGYHLFTVRFSTENGASLQIDNGEIHSDNSFTLASGRGLQVGSVLGGIEDPFQRGEGFVVLKMLAFGTDSIPSWQYEQLCKEYPAVTNHVLVTIGSDKYYRLRYAKDALAEGTSFTVSIDVSIDLNAKTISSPVSGESYTFAELGQGVTIIDNGDGTYSLIKDMATTAVLRISEIMPKPTDDQDPGEREGMDVNGLESGWVEVENTSDQWADLKDYKFIRSNRGKKTGQADFGNFPSVLIAPNSRFVFYTSERYSNSADMTVSAWATPDEGGVKPKIYTGLGNILVWPDKVNPKKSPFVRLTYTPSNTIVDTVIIPSDVPEGYSIIVGETKPGEATKRWLCPTPTRGTANTDTAGLVKIGPNVGPLYELTTGKKHDSASEFARPVPTAQPGEDYEIVFSLNPVMSPTEAGGFRDEDAIESITLVYRTDLTNETHEVSVSLLTDSNDTKDWGHTYKAYIPADALPAAGHLVQWKFEITDVSENEWTSPSFNNPDDGYEWYGTIVEPDQETQMSATLPTWHMFASGHHLTQMDVDSDKQNRTLVPNQARVAIYDSSTSNYYDYVRIDLRGNTSAGFTKKGHGLRFAKAHPLTMTDVVTGETIEDIRKTSLISEYADPSYMRQMIAFWLWRKMGNKVPFDFPVRCNLNGEFYQLAFNSERFTDELIEDVYGLDKFGYGYKNVGTLKSGTGTTAGKIEKKTPDDEDESNITVLQNELRAKITAAQNVDGTTAAAKSSTTTDTKGLDNADLTKFVVQKFNLPAWLNYLASARITQEMDDVWANVCAYYDNAEMHEDGGVRGTGTWMPLGYDFNLSFGQWYYGDIGGTRSGLMSNQDWFKSHPFYGGNRVRCWKQEGMTGTCNYGNDGFEAVWQSAKFRRLFLRRLRTLMDQELKEPGTSEEDTPFMAKMREMADLMRADAALDKNRWPNNNTDDAIDVWTTRPDNMDVGIDDIWENYVVPRREHLYVTHSITNTAKTIGYGSNLNAGIPEAQSPIAELKAGFSVENATDMTMTAIDDTEKVVIMNSNAEAVDMSGWRLTGRFEMTLPAGSVVDANDTITVVVDRRAYIVAHDLELTDQVIIGNAKLNADSTTLLLNDADGTKVLQVAPPSDESLYLRLHSFDGIPPSPSDGDTDEWITLTNISETATLDLSGVRVVFLKTGDSVAKCDFTIQEGQIAPLGSVTVRQSDYAAAGWTKITNGELTISIYDANGLVAHSGGVVQKNYKNYRGAGGPGGNFFIRLNKFEATFASGDFEEVTYPVMTVDVVPGEDATLEAETQEDAEAALADCEIVLSAEDEKAGLVTDVLKLVAVPVVSEDTLTGLVTTNYVARVEVDETQVSAPAIAEPVTEDDKPVTVEDDEDGNKTVSARISNAVIGLWYGYEVSDSLGSAEDFEIDTGSFERAGDASHTIIATPRDSSKTSGFFRVKVLPAQPKASN